MRGHAGSTERRAVLLRELAVFRRLADYLASQGVRANTISLVGLLAGVGGGLALAASAWEPSERLALLLGGLLVLGRLLANMLDGMVATASGQAGPIGELWNEVPDRLSDAATLIGAGYAVGGCPELGYLAACLALLVAYVRSEGKVAGGPQEFCGPMAKPQRMFVVVGAALYLALAPVTWRPSWAGIGLMSAALVVVIVGSAWTFVRRLRRVVCCLQGKRP